MEFRPNGFDLWVFHRALDEPRYLLLRSSQDKADKWFNGARFWQIPSDFVGPSESVPAALHRELDGLGLDAKALWAVEHTYTIYNIRYEDTVLLSVFAAEVEDESPVKLTAQHSEAQWCTAGEATDKLRYRGLKEGLHWLRTYISESDDDAAEFRLRPSHPSVG